MLWRISKVESDRSDVAPLTNHADPLRVQPSLFMMAGMPSPTSMSSHLAKVILPSPRNGGQANEVVTELTPDREESPFIPEELFVGPPFQLGDARWPYQETVNIDHF
jgi:hypothetical protein